MPSITSIGPGLARSLPFALFIALLALRGQLEDAPWLAASLDTRWLYAVQAGAAALGLMWLRERYVELRWRSAAARPLGGLVMSVLLGLGVFAMWISLDHPWMRLGEPAASFEPVGVDGELQWPLIVLRGAGAVLVVPLMEELFWRSFLMRWIDRRDFLSQSPQGTSIYALVVSSAVFALGHDMWLAGLLAGLCFGALYRHTGQIWHAVVAHATANLALAAWVVHQRAWGFW